MSSQSTYYSIAQTAEILGCGEKTVRRMISRGELKAVRIGRMIRIRERDIERAERPVTSLAQLRGGSVD